MPVSPDDIERKEFDQGMRGYDKDQVRAFLNEVAADYRAALRLGNYEAVGEEVGRILQTVNDSAAALRSKATSEAEEILARAEADARQLKDGAQEDATKLRNQAEVEARGLREHTDQQVKELVDEAEKRVQDMIREADQRVETLRQAERDLRGRLDRAREMLTSISDQLDATQDSPETESVALEQEGEPATR